MKNFNFLVIFRNRIIDIMSTRMGNSLLSLVLVALFSVSIFGCRSTPAKRIDERPEAFKALSPEDQLKIQQGDIDVGYTEDMVYMAKGDPAKKEMVNRGGRSVMIWTYSKPTFAETKNPNQGTGFRGVYGYPDPSKPSQSGPPMFYGGPSYSVEFEKGKVVRDSDGLKK